MFTEKEKKLSQLQSKKKISKKIYFKSLKFPFRFSEFSVNSFGSQILRGKGWNKWWDWKILLKLISGELLENSMHVPKNYAANHLNN